jgi:hypothetical protein
MDGPIENARTAVMKWIVPVRHPYILNVTINTVFHPGDNGQLGYWVSTVGSKLGRLVDFWHKIEHTPRKLLYFVNRHNANFSSDNFYGKNHLWIWF